jgi:hypothetical protein
MFRDQQRRVYAARLRQLQQLGLAMPFEHTFSDTQPPEIFVEQCSAGFDSSLFDLHDGRTLYFVWLSLAAEKAAVSVYDFRFVPPWPDNNFVQLPAFADSSRGGAYVLPNNWDLPREDVLNFRFGKTGWRLSSRRVEGVLCGLSETPIPAEYPHGAQIEVGVKFYGRSGQQLGETTVLPWADRWDERAVKPTTKRLPTVTREVEPSAPAQPCSSGLYEGGEIVDSRSRPALRERGSQSADPGSRLPDHSETGTWPPASPDRR